MGAHRRKRALSWRSLWPWAGETVSMTEHLRVRGQLQRYKDRYAALEREHLDLIAGMRPVAAPPADGMRHTPGWAVTEELPPVLGDQLTLDLGDDTEFLKQEEIFDALGLTDDEDEPEDETDIESEAADMIADMGLLVSAGPDETEES